MHLNPWLYNEISKIFLSKNIYKALYCALVSSIPKYGAVVSDTHISGDSRQL